MAFSATLSPPSGQAATTNYQCRSGAVITPAGNGNIVVANEGDYQDFIKQGWVAVSITRS